MDAEQIDTFREFVRVRFGPLRALAYVTCGDWQTAEDAVAGALARLYLRWDRVTSPDAYAAERYALEADDRLLLAHIRYGQAKQLQHLRHIRGALHTLAHRAWIARLACWRRCAAPTRLLRGVSASGQAYPVTACRQFVVAIWTASQGLPSAGV